LTNNSSRGFIIMKVPVDIGAHADLTLITSGPFGKAFVTPKVLKMLQQSKKSKLMVRRAGVALLEMVVNKERQLLMAPANHKFAFEGHHPIKDGTKDEVPIWALKNTQIGLRLYGVMFPNENDQSIFIATEYDDNKKQDEADQAKLKNAAKIFGGLL
jgi:hypothetical protein